MKGTAKHEQRVGCFRKDSPVVQLTQIQPHRLVRLSAMAKKESQIGLQTNTTQDGYQKDPGAGCHMIPTANGNKFGNNIRRCISTLGLLARHAGHQNVLKLPQINFPCAFMSMETDINIEQ